MIIDKILNNNVVVVVDQDNKEKVVMGRGIAFKKRPGDSFDDNQIEKTFEMSTTALGQFEELLKDIPMEYFQLVEEVVEYAKLSLDTKFSDLIYVSLVDHIYSCLKRYQEGITISNALLWEIKKFYPNEYLVGLYALDRLESLGPRLPDDEAGFIALHFVNSRLDGDHTNPEEVIKIMTEVTNLVRYYFKIELDEDSVYYYRFITHLKFFAQRLITKQQPYGDDSDLLEVIKVKYQAVYNCVLKIASYIKEKYDYQLSSDELLYLTIHIERVVYKSAREKEETRK
ncbi:MAG: PRD domain-containing protein [Erysipelotrichaceae bacterium]|nr:PRD domain-containing protein [Erysipelotrichaceae bacterium]MDD3808872.1 PRD domain-containing protein [Erysipelotrichaceae bacterium]